MEKMEMDKVEQLIIRACKSGHAELERVQRVFKRFYPNFICMEEELCTVLTEIADKYSIVKPSALAEAFAPQNARFYGIDDSDTHAERVIKIMISKIAISPKYRFPGLTAPLALRNQDQEACIA